MTEKKKPNFLDYLDTFTLAYLMMKFTKRASVATATLGVRAIAGTTRVIVRRRHQRRYLR